MRIICLGANGLIDIPYDGVYLALRANQINKYTRYDVVAYSVANPTERVATLRKNMYKEDANKVIKDIVSANDNGCTAVEIVEGDKE